MESSKLYVGNLKYAITDEQLAQLFAEFGEVKSANVIKGKGFGFVEMGTIEEADKAAEALNGKEYEGRTLRIADAHPPRTDKKEFRNKQ
ncbi:MAG: RNA-binding protein [Candidatus Neomarinimicrobiota bacterium]